MMPSEVEPGQVWTYKTMYYTVIVLDVSVDDNEVIIQEEMPERKGRVGSCDLDYFLDRFKYFILEDWIHA